MNGTPALPFVVLLMIAVVLLVRSREVRPWVAVVLLLCGMYLGSTSVRDPIVSAVNWLVDRLLG